MNKADKVKLDSYLENINGILQCPYCDNQGWALFYPFEPPYGAGFSRTNVDGYYQDECINCRNRIVWKYNGERFVL